VFYTITILNIGSMAKLGHAIDLVKNMLLLWTNILSEKWFWLG